MDLSSWRSEFPVLEHKAYLIGASLGPVSQRSRAYLEEYLDAWASKGAPDHVWFEEIFPRMASLKRSFSMLAGCDPDEVALTTNISIALSTIASCLDLSGDRRTVILSELDFPTDGHVWLAWARKTGAEIRWLRSSDGLTIPVEEYDRAIDERTALVMVNRVLYRSSAIVDAKAVCAIARDRGALSFVDDYHGLGIVHWISTTSAATSTPPVSSSGCSADRGSCSSMPGAICSPRSSPPSRGGSRNGAVLLRCGASRLSPHGAAWSTARPRRPCSSSRRAGSTSSRRWDRPRSASGTASSPIRHRPGGRSGSRGAHAAGPRRPRRRREREGRARVGEDRHQLLARDVCTDYRGDGLRISPHFFNTEEDVDRCFDELRRLV